MAQVKLESKKRDKAGKGVARKLRAEGRIPAVLYGRASQPMSLELEEKAVATLMKEYGLNPIIELSVEAGQSSEVHTCMIADFQKDVYQRFVTHLDLKRVDLTQKVMAAVQLVVVGESDVRSKGGIVQRSVDTIHVHCLPADIPKVIELDISALGPGEHLSIKDVSVPAGVELVDPPDTALISVFSPRGMVGAEEGAGEAEAAAAPEGEE